MKTEDYMEKKLRLLELRTFLVMIQTLCFIFAVALLFSKY